MAALKKLIASRPFRLARDGEGSAAWATPQRMPLADVLSNQGIDGQRTGTARPFPQWRLRAARIGRPSIQLLGSGIAPQARIAGHLTFSRLFSSPRTATFC